MNLFAYAQIDELDVIAKNNGIEVPRLRGYLLMKDETPDSYFMPTKEEITRSCVEELCRSEPFWNPNADCTSYDDWTDFLVQYFLTPDGKPRWDRIHGWKRKTLKFMIKQELKRHKKQREAWNKYVGRDDVLYIHARIGGGNWPYYCDKVVGRPWFLEKVDDAFDCTYCDIYAKIKEIE